LFILPENTLCQNIKIDGYDAITFNKLFNLYCDDQELKKSRHYNIDNYNTICFDEIGKLSPDRLKRISNFIKENPTKNIFACGDYRQIKPIDYDGKTTYLNECINIVFPKQILFSKIK
jgi:hypothetical protein